MTLAQRATEGEGQATNLWAPGDGSETFVGEPGLNAIIFASTDREAVADPATGVRLPTFRSVELSRCSARIKQAVQSRLPI
jgi:hypothetical protein